MKERIYNMVLDADPEDEVSMAHFKNRLISYLKETKKENLQFLGEEHIKNLRTRQNQMRKWK